MIEEIIMKTIQITLPPDLHRDAKALAARLGVPMKELVYAAIATHVRARQPSDVRRSRTKGGSR